MSLTIVILQSDKIATERITHWFHSMHVLSLNGITGFCTLLNQQDGLDRALVNQGIQDIHIIHIQHVQHSRIGTARLLYRQIMTSIMAQTVISLHAHSKLDIVVNVEKEGLWAVINVHSCERDKLTFLLTSYTWSWNGNSWNHWQQHDNLCNTTLV